MYAGLENLIIQRKRTYKNGKDSKLYVLVVTEFISSKKRMPLCASALSLYLFSD